MKPAGCSKAAGVAHKRKGAALRPLQPYRSAESCRTQLGLDRISVHSGTARVCLYWKDSRVSVRNHTRMQGSTLDKGLM
eukprot:1312139-Amphidinium_carterae.3